MKEIQSLLNYFTYLEIILISFVVFLLGVLLPLLRFAFNVIYFHFMGDIEKMVMGTDIFITKYQKTIYFLKDKVFFGMFEKRK